MSAAPSAPRNLHDPYWDGPNPSTCDDLVWQEFTGMCGGCAETECHNGPCSEVGAVDPFYGYTRLLCDHCPIRIGQGWFSGGAS